MFRYSHVSMPVFSIIIPTYNSEDKIARAIESILIQSFSDFEICVIDGASSDNSRKHCKSRCPNNVVKKYFKWQSPSILFLDARV